MSRVVLAMSGGVDSSVAAHLLCEAGHEVIGVFMRHGERSPVAQRAVCPTRETELSARNSSPSGSGGSRSDQVRAPLSPGLSHPGPLPVGEGGHHGSPAPGDQHRGSLAPEITLPILSPRTDHKQGCCTAADAEDGRRVADRLGIPFYALDLAEEFGRIMDYFVDEYTHARTPNPCVVCNNWIKFGKLFDYADGVGADFVATGHYAQLIPTEAGPALCRGVDDGKDQSYVLFGVGRALLSRMLLPVGRFKKPQIRKLAEGLGLRVADKPDSQEICFVTSGKHHEFVRRRRGDLDTSGVIVTTEGALVGRHDGIERFTIGQRKGLGVALGEPRFVVRIESDTNRVVIGPRDQMARYELTAAELNWLVDPPADPFRCEAKIRYNTPAAPATVEPSGDGRIRVRFDEPVFGVAPGQAVVCYDGSRVLGGGWIE